MKNNSLPKIKRQQELSRNLEKNPFLTDEELAKIFSVSIQTIRLDRLELGIPELRERMKKGAEKAYGEVKSLTGSEIVGELLDLELDKSGLSVLEVSPEMVLQKTKIARGHHLFAQANSLAVAVIDAETALTGSAKVTFKRPVYLGEKVVAKAIVKGKKGNKYIVCIVSKVKGEVVFEGEFMIFAIDRKEGYLA